MALGGTADAGTVPLRNLVPKALQVWLRENRLSRSEGTAVTMLGPWPQLSSCPPHTGVSCLRGSDAHTVKARKGKTDAQCTLDFLLCHLLRSSLRTLEIPGLFGGGCAHLTSTPSQDPSFPVNLSSEMSPNTAAGVMSAHALPSAPEEFQAASSPGCPWGLGLGAGLTWLLEAPSATSRTGPGG